MDNNANIGPLLNFMLNVESLYNRLQSLLCNVQTDKKAVRHTYLNFGFR